MANGLSPNSHTPDGRSLLEAAAHHGRGEVLAALVAGAGRQLELRLLLQR